MKKVLAKGLTLLTLALLLALPAFAQQTADIIGTISDESGGPLPGVTISVESPALMGSRSTVSNANGSFLIRLLPPGEYVLTTTMAGMETVKQSLQLTVGGTVRPKIVMRPESTQETLIITAETNSVLDSTQVSANFSSELMDALPVGRTVLAATQLAAGVSSSGPGGAPTISGAMSFENSFLLNGGSINGDNVRGTPASLFIEDAIQETTVLSGSVSAEYGQFIGGVVNSITKQGGNEFSGSLRVSLTNDKWRSKTPFEKENNSTLDDKVNEFDSITLGGPIVKDHLWFFVAGRRQRDSSAAQISAAIPVPDAVAAEIRSYGFDPGTPNTGRNISAEQNDDRYEIKLTGAINPDHTVVFSYLDKQFDEVNDTQFGVISESAVLKSRSIPESLLSINYRGIITPNLTVDALYTERKRTFERTNEGGTTFETGSTLEDFNTQDGNNYGSNFFGLKPEDRNNENASVKFSYFLPTTDTGTHDFVVGYSHFMDTRKADNEQSPSGWRNFPTATIFDANGQAVPLFYDGDTSPNSLYGGISYWPVLNASKGSDFSADALFVNDVWTLNEKLRFNIGFRYDANKGKDQSGASVVDDNKLSPRLSASYDLSGDGRNVFSIGYGSYVARLSSQGDSASSAGAPALYYWYYHGAPTTSMTAVYNWFVETYGADFYEPANARNNADAVREPGSSTLIEENSLTSPYATEYQLGYSTRFGSKGWFKVDYINREFKDFYVGFTNREIGQSPTGADLEVIRNDSEYYHRKYQGVQGQFSWLFSSDFSVGGNFTISKLEGNINGETAGSGSIRSTGLTRYPEFNNYPNREPEGRLLGDVPYTFRAWATYKLDSSVGDWTFAGLQRFEAGRPYGANSTLPVPVANSPYHLPGRNDFGYRTPPQTVTYNWTGRDAFSTDDWNATDLSINWSLNLKKIELFVNIEYLNIFDGDAVVFNDEINTTVIRGTAFNVYTETPVEGVNYTLGQDFGKGLDNDAYQTPRTFRFDLGLRF